MPSRAIWVLFLAGSLLGARSDSRADEPLHRRIDRHIAEQAGTPLAARTTDAEFVRRVYLDLIGRIPSADETRAFLAERSADKRTALIDRLLADDGYARRMRDAFHVMRMERRGDHAEWSRFLEESFAANKPWNQLVAEILKPDLEQPAIRGAAFFHTRRLFTIGQQETDFPGLTRDVGRMFLGIDLQCAQCHDHPFIDDYAQRDFQGLFVAFENTFIRTDVDFPAVGEKLLTQPIKFVSVFTGESGKTGPRLPHGVEIAIPKLGKDDEYVVPPDRKTKFPGIPKFSPLARIAEELPRAENPAFARNIVNRLWFLMLGRGLVHPLDLHHSGNPPSHPELLDELAAAFVDQGYDMQWFVRELALTETYQRSSRLPDGVDDVAEDRFAVAIERGLSAEQLLQSMLLATGERERLLRGSPADKHPALLEKATNSLSGLFASAFGNAPMDPEDRFNPTLRSALLLLNDSKTNGWLEPQSGNLVARLATLDDAAELADALYLAILSRLPTDEERGEVAEVLSRLAHDKPRACRLLAWGLLAGAEFATNH